MNGFLVFFSYSARSLPAYNWRDDFRITRETGLRKFSGRRLLVLLGRGFEEACRIILPHYIKFIQVPGILNLLRECWNVLTILRGCACLGWKRWIWGRCKTKNFSAEQNENTFYSLEYYHAIPLYLRMFNLIIKKRKCPEVGNSTLALRDARAYF